MAILKRRLHRKNSSGGYDTVHIETSSDLVLMSDGSTTLTSKISSMDTAINGKAASNHTHSGYAAASHNHDAGNITSGTLGTARGGTGITSNPSMLTNLGSGSAASVFAASPRPGVTGTLPVANGGTGVTSIDALKSALGVSAASYYLKGLTVGKVVWFNYDHWRVIHIDNGIYYLMLNEISETTQFGSNNTYAGSTIAAKCIAYQNDMAVDSLALCQNVTVNGVTAKVFIPNYDLMSGSFGYSYLNDQANCVAYIGGKAFNWWTSTPYNKDYAYCVNTNGGLNYVNPSIEFGFRPCVALAL